MRKISIVGKTVSAITLALILLVSAVSMSAITASATETEQINYGEIVDDYIVWGEIRDTQNRPIDKAIVIAVDIDISAATSMYSIDGGYEINLAEDVSGGTVRYGDEIWLYAARDIFIYDASFIVEPGTYEKRIDFIINPPDLPPGNSSNPGNSSGSSELTVENLVNESITDIEALIEKINTLLKLSDAHKINHHLELAINRLERALEEYNNQNFEDAIEELHHAIAELWKGVGRTNGLWNKNRLGEGDAIYIIRKTQQIIALTTKTSSEMLQTDLAKATTRTETTIVHARVGYLLEKLEHNCDVIDKDLANALHHFQDAVKILAEGDYDEEEFNASIERGYEKLLKAKDDVNKSVEREKITEEFGNWLTTKIDKVIRTLSPRNSFSYDLVTGWNLLSLPLLITTYEASEILSEITNSQTVMKWEGGGWTAYNVGDPVWMDYAVIPDYGYFVKTTAASSWTISDGLPVDPRSVELVHGWNLVGWTSPTVTTSASMLLTKISRSTLVMRWESGGWEAYNKGDPFFNDFDIEPGRGYFVHVTHDTTWEYLGEGYVDTDGDGLTDWEEDNVDGFSSTTITTFSDGSTQKTLDFTTVEDQTVYVNIPDKKYAIEYVSSASMDLDISSDSYAGDFLWSYTTGSTAGYFGVSASPAVVNGKVFVGAADFKFYCLDETNGNLLWSYTTGWCIRSSPAVVNGKVFFGSNDDKVYCLDDDGNLLWSYTTLGEVQSSPAVSYGRVFVACYDPYDSANNRIYCLDEDDGTLLWEYTISHTVSSPAVADGYVFIGDSGGNVYCLSEYNGDLIWSYSTGGSINSSSCVVADNMVFIGDYWNNKIYGLDRNTGALMWTYTITYGIVSSPAIADGKMFIGGGKKVYAFDFLGTGNGWPQYRGNPQHTGTSESVLLDLAKETYLDIGNDGDNEWRWSGFQATLTISNEELFHELNR